MEIFSSLACKQAPLAQHESFFDYAPLHAQKILIKLSKLMFIGWSKSHKHLKNFLMYTMHARILSLIARKNAAVKETNTLLSLSFLFRHL